MKSMLNDYTQKVQMISVIESINDATSFLTSFLHTTEGKKEAKHLFNCLVFRCREKYCSYGYYYEKLTDSFFTDSCGYKVEIIYST
jgi:hypothetical protein